MSQVGKLRGKSLPQGVVASWNTHPDSHDLFPLFFSTQLKGSRFPTTWTSCVGPT